MLTKRNAWRLLKVVIALVSFTSGEAATTVSKRPITVTDCVQTRRVFEGQVVISPDGSLVAYVVEAPNVQTNKNEYFLYIRDIARPDQRNNGRVLLKADMPIRGTRWVAGGMKLAILRETPGKWWIQLIDVASSQAYTIAETSVPILSFSSDADGSIFVYAAAGARSDDPQAKEAEERGYPVIFGSGMHPPILREDAESVETPVFIAKRKRDGSFGVRRLFAASSNPVVGRPPLTGVAGLSLSPDGRYITFNYQMPELPKEWETNPYAIWLDTAMVKQGQIALGLYDFQTGRLRVALNCAGAGWGKPSVWASDSRAFSILALSPANSSWEQRDRKSGFLNFNQFELFTHLFSVDVEAGVVSEVLEKPPDWLRNPTLWWKASHDTVLVRKSQEIFSWLKREDTEWKLIGESHLSLGQDVELRTHISSFAPNQLSDGVSVVGSFERPSVPPDVFIHYLKDDQTVVLTDLNPEYHEIALGEIEKVEWQDRLGVHCTGLLIRPVGYEPKKKYPLVIMTKGWGNGFLSDTGFHTAFPPQQLANVGFLVLMANVPPLPDLAPWYGSLQKEPGKMAEAYEFISFVESAVVMLEGRGLADKGNVGIIGFSRTSWQTDFMLTHSDFPFVAASSADSGIYTYGSYWKLNSEEQMKDYDDMMGGPPYGATFENWVRFAPPFNVENVRVPVLMEYTNGGSGSEGGLEFFVALKKQNKPVELIYYPQEEHMLNTPYARVASLQRNVDWFRFWMQGYERTPPAYDRNQYVRWCKLRQQEISLHH